MIYFFVFIISCACLFFSNIYWPQYPVAWVFLMAGIMIMASQVRFQLYNLPEKRYSLLLALLFILLATIIPYPHNLGFILASAGMLLVVFFHNKRLLVNFSISLLVTGLILIVWSVINPLYYIYSSRFHELESINLLIGPLLNLFNLSYSAEGSNLYIQSFLEVQWIKTSLEKTGIYFSLIFYVASLVIILLFGQKKVKTSLKVLLVLVIYIVVRYLLIILLFLHFGRADIFWNRWVEIISFIPLVFILMKFIPFRKANFNSSINFRKFTLKRSYFYPATLIILIVFLICMVFLFPDPGKVKEGRVLLDEMHSDWEWTEEKFDTAWYGKKSCYNYYCLADYISHYYQFERNFDPITPAVLRKYDILIIKTPTSSFENSEIRAIEEFVDAGGGLMLIGDHTNVFGTSTYINHITGRFGLRLNYDATYDFKTGDLSVFSPPGFYSHPVVQSMPTFLFGSSCSLQAPLLADNMIMGYGLKAVYLDYSKKNFFSTENNSASMNYGVFLQCAGVKYGKGRVLVFTDSTVFSNFWVFMPGKPELFMGMMNWLNRSNSILSLKFLLLIVCVVLAWLLRKKLKTNTSFEKLSLLILFGGLSFVLSTMLFSQLKSVTYSLPEPHEPYYRICIDNEYSDIDMPIISLESDIIKSYNTFFIAIQRLGFFPNIAKSSEEALEKNDLVIMINPVKIFSNRDMRRISSFIEGGGKLLLLDNPANGLSTSEQVLNDFTMDPVHVVTIDSGPSKDTKDVDPGPDLINLSCYPKGRGALYVINDSELFNDFNMGNSNAVPNDYQLKKYKLAYNLIEYIVSNTNN